MTTQPTGSHEDDRRADLTLRAVGPSLGLAEGLSAIELAAITGREPKPQAASRHPRTPRARKERFMRRTRVLTMGSAMLVALTAGAAVLWTSGSGQQARAASILRSLRASSIRGLDVTLTNLGDTDLFVTGQIRVRFTRPIDLGEVLQFGESTAPAMVQPRIDQVHATLDLTMGSGGPLPGASGHVEFASSESSTWVFVQAPELGPNVAEVFPPLAMFRGVLQNGALINLGQEVRAQIVALNEPEPPAGSDAAAPLGLHAHAGVVVTPGVSDNPAPPPSGSAHSRRVTVSLTTREPAMAPPAEAPPAPAPGASDGRERQLGSVVGSMFAGEAGPAQLQEFQRLLSDDAHVEVVDQGGGLFLLRSTDPASTDGEELRLSYQEGLGIRFAEVANLPDPHGGRAGVVRLVFADDAIAPALLDAQRLIVPGTTFQYDLPAIIGLFGQR